jgi:hypothetical protein
MEMWGKGEKTMQNLFAGRPEQKFSFSYEPVRMGDWQCRQCDCQAFVAGANYRTCECGHSYDYHRDSPLPDDR